MIISQLSQTKDETFAQISARVQFEESNQPEKIIFIKTPHATGDKLSLNPHAFLVGCLIPAMHFHEKRIKMDEKICPTLLEGLGIAMAITQVWTQGDYTPLKLETGVLDHALFSDNRHAGMVMSGGMDSLAALRLNRLRYPASHPGSIKEGLFIHGFDIGGVVERGMKYHVYDRAVTAITRITDDADVELVPVYTNIRHLCDNRVLWLENFFGAVLASISHAFAKVLHMVYIGSCYDVSYLHPNASHPLRDPEYSSHDMRIRHRDHDQSRLDKIKIVAGWEVALNNFRVCLANVPDRLNCGVCEKCVRTMIELLAIGALDKTAAFVENDVTPDMIAKYDITIRKRPPYYQAVLPLLRKQGRMDLVNTIEKLLQKGNV